MARRTDETPTVVFGPEVITASGRFFNLQRESTEEPSKRLQRIGHAQAWQYDAEYFMETIGEAWYAHNYVGDAISRGKWGAGWVNEQGDIIPARNDKGDPEPGVDAQLLALAEEAIDRLSGPGGHAIWSRPLGTCISSVAEGWLIGYHVNDDGDPVPEELEDGSLNQDAVEEVWEAYSPTAVNKVRGEDDKWCFKVRRYAYGDYETLPSDAVGCRVWRRGKYPEDADGPMSALLDICEDLTLLQRAVRGSALSRTHAGLLLIPQEGLGQPMPAASLVMAGSGADGQGPPANPVVTEIVAGLSTPARDPGSAASLVPTPITTKADFIDKWKHLPLSRDLDPQLAIERQELLRRFAQGNNLPPEVILGMADLNHWTAWQVGADAWRHIEPIATTMRDGLTVGYLWHSMRASLADAGSIDGIEQVAQLTPEQRAAIKQFWMLYDPSAVLRDPDRSEDADKAFENGAISWDAYRRYKGFESTDAPTEQELAHRLELGYSKARPSPQSQAEGIPGAPVAPTPVPDAPPAAPTKAAADVVTASARHVTSGLAAALAALDHEHLSRTVELTHAAVAEAVAQAGAQLRSKAQKDPSMRSLLRGKPAAEVGQAIGPAAARRLFTTDDHTFDDLFAVAVAGMLARYRDVTASVNAQYARLVAKHTGVPLTDAEVAGRAADAVASEAVLQGGVTDLARARLFDQTAHSLTTGEVPAGVNVPTSVARRASARAGGAHVDGSVDLLPRWEGGIATGQDSVDLFQARGLVKSGLTWDYGFGGRKDEFEPHVELDTLTFESPDDEGLDVTPWGLAYPGDHSGCLCTWALEFDVAGDLVDIGDGEVTDGE